MTKFQGKGWHVCDRVFEIEIKSVDNCSSEGSREVQVCDGRPKYIPNAPGGDLCFLCVVEAALGVRSTAERQEDGFPILLLALFNILTCCMLSILIDSVVKNPYLI